MKRPWIDSLPQPIEVSPARTAAPSLKGQIRTTVSFSGDFSRMLFTFLAPGRMCQIDVPIRHVYQPGAPPQDFGP
jgi:hypothetical protein